MKKKVFFTTIVALTSISAWASLSSVQVNYNEMNILSAFSVFTKQEAVSSSQKSSMVHNSIQQLATAIGAIGMSERMKEALINFNSSTGQPESLRCDAQNTSKKTVIIRAEQDIETSDITKTVSSYPSNNLQAKEDKLVSSHAKYYCSDTDQEQGFCQVKSSSFQNWDIDYQKAFGGEVDSRGFKSSIAFSNNLTNFTAGVNIDNCTTSQTNCDSAEYNNLEPLTEASMVTAVLVNQGYSKKQPIMRSKREQQ